MFVDNRSALPYYVYMCKPSNDGNSCRYGVIGHWAYTDRYPSNIINSMQLFYPRGKDFVGGTVILISMRAVLRH